MYSRKDKSPRLVTPGFEHLNNFVLFDDGNDVFVKRIDNDESLTTNLVQYTNVSLSSACSHYTMTIQELTDGEFIMFGLTNRCVPGHPLWTIDRSVRYHSNDGGVFNGGLGVRTYHPYTIGDRVTCKLDYTGPDRSLVNFLKNDRLVYRQWVNLPPGQLYATIGVSRTEAKLTVEWPKPGKPDISIKKDLPSNWFGYDGLHRDDETKKVNLAQLATDTERGAYNIQSPAVFDKSFNYFEIEITEKAEGDTCHAIGLVAGNCEPFVMPGWTSKSIGYHSDDGGLICDNSDKSEDSSDEKKANIGDVMGCGVIFPDIDESHFREPILVLVYFTLNGKIVHKKRMRQPRGGFFPCIGFLAKGDECKLMVDAKPNIDRGELLTKLNSADGTTDFRCSEVVQFSELAPDSATFSLTLESDEGQLVQLTKYPMSNVGDGFHLQVLDLRPNTEMQLGVSVADHPMEGSFLGSNSTSCGYMFKLGSLVMKEGMRPVAKWAGLKDTITCYLDFQDERLAVLCFESSSGDMIGRATVTRSDVSSPLYGSVLMSSGPCVARINWSRSIYNTQHVDRSWGSAEDWLRPVAIKANKNKFTLEKSESYSFAACAQCRQPVLTGSSFFSIRLLGGETLPGIGLSKATTDVSNVLGSDKGEVCFLPSSGELLIENNKWVLENPPKFQAGDILQCGMIFAEQDRVEQKGVVFFSLNEQPFFHCRFHMAHGGAYASIALASAGCSAELLETSRASPIPESIASEWLNEDGMVGAVPYKAANDHMTSNGYTLEKASYNPNEDVTVVESKADRQLIYVSYSIRENDRVNPILTALQKHFLTCLFATSAQSVEITDKRDALNSCQFVLIFISNIYVESHEMAMEYSMVEESGKPVLVAAHSQMQWPPGHYFTEHGKKMERYPMVKVSTADVTSEVDKLIKLVAAQLQESDKKASKKSKQATSKHSATNGTAAQRPPEKSPSKDSNKSSACIVL